MVRKGSEGGVLRQTEAWFGKVDGSKNERRLLPCRLPISRFVLRCLCVRCGPSCIHQAGSLRSAVTRVRCPDPTTDKLLLKASSLDKFGQLVKERARDASDGSFSPGFQGFFDKASLFGSESFPLRGSSSVSGPKLVLGDGARVTLSLCCSKGALAGPWPTTLLRGPSLRNVYLPSCHPPTKL